MVQPRSHRLGGHELLSRVTQTPRQHPAQLLCRKYHDLVHASRQSEHRCAQIQLGLKSQGIKILCRPQDAANELCCRGFGVHLTGGCAAPDRRRSLRHRFPFSSQRTPNRGDAAAKWLLRALSLRLPC